MTLIKPTDKHCKMIKDLLDGDTELNNKELSLLQTMDILIVTNEKLNVDQVTSLQKIYNKYIK